MLNVNQDVSARSAALYWAAVTVGRISASVAALRVRNEWILGGSMGVALAALLLLGQAGSVAVALAALAAVGLGFAAIYPTVMAITARAYPRRFAAMVGVLVAAGGLGGILFPWLGGVVGQASGLRATIWLDTLAAAALLACFVLYMLLYARLTP